MSSIKQDIIEKSLSLFFRYGIRSVSMDEVASQLGMSKKTLYQYFENKDDLVMHTVLSFIEKDVAHFQHIREQSDNSIEELLRFVRHITQMLRTVSPALMYDLRKYHNSSWEAMETLRKKYVYRQIRENIEKGQARELYRAEIDADIAAKLYMATTLGIVNEDIFPMPEYAKDKVISEFVNLSLHAWTSEKGKEVWQSLGELLPLKKNSIT